MRRPHLDFLYSVCGGVRCLFSCDNGVVLVCINFKEDMMAISDVVCVIVKGDGASGVNLLQWRTTPMVPIVVKNLQHMI